MHNVHSKIPRMKENEGPNGVQNEKKPCLRYDGFAQLTAMVLLLRNRSLWKKPCLRYDGFVQLTAMVLLMQNRSLVRGE